MRKKLSAQLHDFVVVVCSLRVNLDMGKTVYAHAIQTDHEIPNTIVRTSTLPEELGRIEYLLSDKVRFLHSHLRARVRLLISMWPFFFTTDRNVDAE